MNKFIKLSLMTLLVITALPMLGMDEETITTGIIPKNETLEEETIRLNAEKQNKNAALRREEQLSDHQQWAYDSRVSYLHNNENAERSLYQEPTKKSIEFRSLGHNISERITSYFSNLWNGRKLKNIVSSISNTSDLSLLTKNEEAIQLFKKLSTNKKLEVINHFVKKEIAVRDNHIKILNRATQQYQTALRLIGSNNIISISENAKIDSEKNIYLTFNTRLNEFRQTMNTLIAENNIHLKYDLASNKFEFHNGKAQEADQISNKPQLLNQHGQSIGYNNPTATTNSSQKNVVTIDTPSQNSITRETNNNNNNNNIALSNPPPRT